MRAKAARGHLDKAVELERQLGLSVARFNREAQVKNQQRSTKIGARRVNSVSAVGHSDKLKIIRRNLY